MKYVSRTLIAVAAMTVLAGLPVQAQEVHVVDAYPLATCPVMSGARLGSMGDPVVKDYDGREVRFCCAGCPAGFERDLEASLEKLDKAIADAQRPHYALEVCPVSGQPLGSMGEPVEAVASNQLVRLCCAGCEGALEADPAQYVAKVAEAIAEKQRDAYPLDTCVVSGEALDSRGGAIDAVVGGRLVRLCCAGCLNGLRRDPAGALKKLDDAG